MHTCGSRAAVTLISAQPFWGTARQWHGSTRMQGLWEQAVEFGTVKDVRRKATYVCTYKSKQSGLRAW